MEGFEMEYKIEKISGIENLIEFEEYYGEIIGYSEGLFLAKQRYARKDVDGLKEFFNISDEEARLVLEEDWHTSHIDIYYNNIKDTKIQYNNLNIY